MTNIFGKLKLNAFRKKWTGSRILNLLAKFNGRLLVSWPIGVGKSYNIDDTIREAVFRGSYDLVIALFPTRRLIKEREWIKNPPINVKIVNLRPRPKRRCGPQLNAQWKVHERNNTGLFGRRQICKHCPRRRGCFWPNQYGKKLRSSSVIFGTQAHLERSPFFIEQLQNWTKAKRMLVLIDEVNFIMKSFERRVSQESLKRFLDALKATTPNFAKSSSHHRWLYLLKLILKAKTSDLRSPQWKMPRISPKWAVAVQEAGWDIHGTGFDFLAYDLLRFDKSPFVSREKLPNGDIRYSTSPLVNADAIIYSGTANPKFLKFRVGHGFANPFENYRFKHPRTVWYNIASSLGTRGFFERNSTQILDFFTQLVIRRIEKGRRPLLIAKKIFVPFVAAQMNSRLDSFGFKHVRVIPFKKTTDLSDKNIVPIINYGIVGTNLFQAFSCAYCLTGYYVNEMVVNSILQDVVASDAQIPIKIKTGGRPRRRKAMVKNIQHGVFDVAWLAQMALNHQEMDVVLQAVGRVRPYTEIREIITFQCCDHPYLDYTKEFDSMAEARKFFRIKSRREYKKSETRKKVKAARKKGLTQKETAKKLGLSLSTIKRCWNG